MSQRIAPQPASQTAPQSRREDFAPFPKKYFRHIEPVYRLLMSELLLDENLNHSMMEAYRAQVAQIESRLNNPADDFEKTALHIHDLAFRMYADCWHQDKPSWCYLALALDIKTEQWLYTHGMYATIESVYRTNP